MKKGLILVEGQTEEQFVKTVLAPHLWTYSLHLEAKIVATKRIKSGPIFKGGIVAFEMVERDLRVLLGDTSAVIVTTMFDLYGLPSDFPGVSTVGGRRGASRAEWIERSLEDHFGNPAKLRAFVTVHEYEGLLFSDPRILADVVAMPEIASALVAVRTPYVTPEDINDGEHTHPSARVLSHCPSYRKRIHGVQAIEQIGLTRVAEKCPHFRGWLTELEGVGG